MNEKSILLVDDDASIRESLAEFLSDYGMQVQTAITAESALNLLKQQNFDLLIADLRLPGISGDLMIPLAHKIRPDMKYLIHTGSIDYRLSSELLDLGLTAEHVLLKPISNLTTLIDKIQSLN